MVSPSSESKILVSDSFLTKISIVCSARALSTGCKSRVSPNSGNYIAKGKGVHRELESVRSRLAELAVLLCLRLCKVENLR